MKKLLISFSGAQSTGKSTLLRECEKTFDKDLYEFVPEITRTIKNELDVPINELGSDLTQTLIIAKHIETHLSVGCKHKILDRCILDGYIYTRYLSNYEGVSVEAVNLAYKIMGKLLSKLDVIFYTEPNDVLLVDDGTRSTSIKFRERVIDLFEDTLPFVGSFTKVVRLKGTVEQRMKKIRETLLSLS